jgi:hypothetical protein
MNLLSYSKCVGKASVDRAMALEDAYVRVPDLNGLGPSDCSLQTEEG